MMLCRRARRSSVDRTCRIASIHMNMRVVACIRADQPRLSDQGSRRCAGVCAACAAWLASAPGLPKLFVRTEPGSILAGLVWDFCRTWPDQAEVTAPGIHFIQEDSGPEIGQAIAAWLRQLPTEPVP